MREKILATLKRFQGVATVEEIICAVRAQNVLAWLERMADDGELVLFNDTATPGKITGAMVRN
jgi:hypothetical protein